MKKFALTISALTFSASAVFAAAHLTGVAWQTDKVAPSQQFRQAAAKAADRPEDQAPGRETSDTGRCQ